MTIRFTVNDFVLTTELEKYARAKVTQLIHRVPRRLRTGVNCTITFSQVHRKGTDFNTCAISFIFSDAQLRAEEMTLHMYSSLDVAAVHVGNQLKDYTAQQGRRHIRGILHTYVHRPAR